MEEITFPEMSFREYISSIDVHLKRTLAAAEKEIEEGEKNISEFPYQHGRKVDFRIKQGFNTVFYDSLIITMYSFLERKMRALCLGLETSHTIKLADISGKGIFQYHRYLEKVCGIDFTKVEEEWKELGQFNLLRNHIVHSAGDRSIPKKRTDLLTFLKKFSGVQTIDGEDSVAYNFKTTHILEILLRDISYINHHTYLKVYTRP